MEKINYRLKMKIMCSGWSMLLPFRYALMRLLLLLGNAVHVSFKVTAALTCLLSSCFCPRADDLAMPGIYPGSFPLPFSYLCCAACNPQGRQSWLLWPWRASMPLQGFPPHALSQLSLTPLTGKESPYMPLSSLELGNPFYPHQNPMAQS